MIGTVKATGFRTDKGYGFIQAETGDDIFFHLSALEKDPTFDETLIERRVRFSIVQTPRGPKAACIRPAE